MESGSHKEGAPAHYPLSQLKHCPVGRRKISYWLAAKNCPSWQPRRSDHHFELSFSSHELLLKTTYSQFLLSSIKGCSPLLFSGLDYGLPEFACPELLFLCYSQTHLQPHNHFCLIFKVDSTCLTVRYI